MYVDHNVNKINYTKCLIFFFFFTCFKIMFYQKPLKYQKESSRSVPKNRSLKKILLYVIYLYVNLFCKPFCIRSENPPKIPAKEFMVFKKIQQIRGVNAASLMKNPSQRYLRIPSKDAKQPPYKIPLIVCFETLL